MSCQDISVQVVLPNGSKVPFQVSGTAVIGDLIGVVAKFLGIASDSIALKSGDRLLLPVVKLSQIVASDIDITAVFNKFLATEEDKEKLQNWAIELSGPPPSSGEPPQEEPVDTQPPPTPPAPEPSIPVEPPPTASPAIRSTRLKHILCRINGVSMRMLVDTGAEASLLYENQLSPEMLASIDRSVTPQIVGVGGVPIQSIGKIHDAIVEIDDKITTESFTVVPGSKITGIIGIRWLENNSIAIYPGKNCMVIDGKTFYFLTDDIY